MLLNDAQWARIAPLLPGKEGDPAGRVKTIAGSLKRCCGLCARGRHGAISEFVRQVVLGVEALPPMGGEGRV